MERDPKLGGQSLIIVCIFSLCGYRYRDLNCRMASMAVEISGIAALNMAYA